MATLGEFTPTLMDTIRQAGQVKPIVEILDQTNEMLQDIPVMETNEGLTHKTTIRTGLPTVYNKRIGEGVRPTKSGYSSIRDGVALIEGRFELPEDLLMFEPTREKKRFRLESEAVAMAEKMAQTHQTQLLYGNVSEETNKFTGFTPRYNSNLENQRQNIIRVNTDSGTNNKTSIWVVGWGMNKVMGLVPSGGPKRSYKREVLGRQTITTSAITATGELGSQKMEVVSEKHMLCCGLAVQDWRYVVRICNIPTTDALLFSNDPDTRPALVTALMMAVRTIQSVNSQTRIYANRRVRMALDIHAKSDVAGGGLTYENFDGKKTMTFAGIPVRTIDALTNKEAAVPTANIRLAENVGQIVWSKSA